MNILLISPLQDQQTGVYIHSALIELGHRVAYFDWRLVTKNSGVEQMNKELIEGFRELKPDLAIVVKGLGILPETIKEIRKFHKEPIVGMIFDARLGEQLVKDVQPYIAFIKELDKFYTTDAEGIDGLKALGIDTKLLLEGCYIPMNKEIVINSVQKQKYGADVVFIGSIDPIHKERMTFLKRIHDEGFYLKIYGEVHGKPPSWIDEHHTGFAAINDYHSIVSQSSKIVLGTDEYRDRKYGFSARLYRVLCAGGFYLTSKAKGIEDFFIPGKHIDVYDNADELVEKISLYLSNDELREKIAKAGQKEVLEKHTYEMRMQELIDDVKPKLLNTGTTNYIIK